MNDTMTTVEQSLAFLNGGGEMGELIRSKDWSNTIIGPPSSWSNSLRTAVSIVINSQFPMFIWWGEELVTIYNDAYRIIAGEKHTELLGKSGREGWAEIWKDLSPLVDDVFSGKSTWSEDQVLFINRHGYTEETYFTFSYSPIWDDAGMVSGLFCACIETTDKVLATRKIKESERNLRNTILQSPVAMCIMKGPTAVIEIANERMFELWGKDPSWMLRRPIFDALPEIREQGLEKIIDDVYTTGRTYKEDERQVTLPRNGKPENLFINFVYHPFREVDGTISGIIAVAYDSTEQVLARRKIEESEQELQARVKERTHELENQKALVDNILKNSSNGISVTEMIRDENGIIIDARTVVANEAAVKFTGLPIETYLTKTARELDPDILTSPYGQVCLETLATGKPSFTQYKLAFTGRWLELTMSKMDDDHLIHIFTDVTPIKEAQLQLERMVDDLKRSNSNLEEFAYAASHDMKEPIRKITYFSSRLKSELSAILTSTQNGLFDRLEKAAGRMGVLIDDLLAYSQVTKGVAEDEPIDLGKIVQTVLEDLELEVVQCNGKINVGDLPTVNGNARQFQQLFQNLVGNALKYRKENTPPVIDICSQIIAGKEIKDGPQWKVEDKDYYLIQVKDNGIGFEQKDAERIFNVFTRLHGNAEFSGTGVGLSIVRKVAENHHGFVSAESELNEGATFKVYLPVE